jgi:hypothetical protein
MPACFLLAAFCMAQLHAGESVDPPPKYVVIDKASCLDGKACTEIPVHYDNVNEKDKNDPGVMFRASIQSTSIDWEAVTGLRLSEYKITFANTNAAGNIGWEMYYLDEFPCYGYAQYVRTWVNAKNKDGFVRVNCLRRPLQIKLAYREAKRDEWQGRTTGILKCKVEKNLSVQLDKCEKQDWSDFAKEQ